MAAGMELLIVALVGVATGVLVKTLTPWYLKLKKIQEEAEQAGVEPNMPKFSSFYVMTGILGFIMAFAPNIGIAFTVISMDIPAGQEGVIAAVIFTQALFGGLGANALLNDNLKTGNAVTFVTGIKKPEEEEDTTKPTNNQ